MLKGLLGNPVSCRDSPGLQKFRPGGTVKACLQTPDGQNLGGPQTRNCPGLASQSPDSSISKDLTGVSLTGTLEEQAKGCILAKARCSMSLPPPRPASVSYGTLPEGPCVGSCSGRCSAEKLLKRPQSSPSSVSAGEKDHRRIHCGEDSRSRRRCSGFQGVQLAAPASAPDPNRSALVKQADDHVFPIILCLYSILSAIFLILVYV